MYAVIKTGGKQYRVAAGEKLKIEQIPSDIGSVLTLDQVLSVSNGDQSLVGDPLVAGAQVALTVLDHGKHDKIRIFKMRRRKHYRKTQGHRQRYTEVFVSGISSSLGSSEADAEASLARAKALRAALDLAAQGGSPEAVAAVRRSYRTMAPAAAPAGEAPESAATPVDAGPAAQADDLTKVEGIGPKIAELLQAAGINTYADLAAADAERLKGILSEAGSRYAAHDPGTWPEQAALAAAGDWDALKKLQDELDGGRRAADTE